MVISTLLAMAVVALGASVLEVLALSWHLSRAARRAPVNEKISVLKPLCGLDPSLEPNLRSFLNQEGVDYELLLGVRDEHDGAFPLATRLAEENPERVKLVLQEGEPGLNPKVNQLVTLARHASGSLFVISDSNVRVQPGYLRDLVAPLADSEVGMVTSPIAGEAGDSLGGQLDALHLQTFITPAVVGAKVLARQDLFIGKSMALRRSDLERAGGFPAFGRLLAEDHALGRAMLRLGKRAELARLPVVNVTRLSLKGFFERYARWGLMQRWVAGPGYPAQLLTFPLLLTVLVMIDGWSRIEVKLLGLSMLGFKLGCDALCVRLLSGRWPSLRTLALVPLKEALMFAAFIKAMVSNKVSWRGNPFYVTRGTRLMSPEARDRLVRIRRA
jgi:ceramide glucosyltransferase